MAHVLNRIEYFTEIDGKSFLDVGCGHGSLMLQAMQRGASEVAGVDVDEKLVENARRKMEENGFKNRSEIHLCGAENLPFEDSSFDMVAAVNVLEHVQDWKKSIEEIERVAKDDAELYVSLPNYTVPIDRAHFKTPAPVFLPESIAKTYLKLARNPVEDYRERVENLNFIPKRKVVGELEGYGFEVQDVAKHKFRNPSLINSEKISAMAPFFVKSRSMFLLDIFAPTMFFCNRKSSQLYNSEN